MYWSRAGTVASTVSSQQQRFQHPGQLCLRGLGLQRGNRRDIGWHRQARSTVTMLSTPHRLMVRQKTMFKNETGHEWLLFAIEPPFGTMSISLVRLSCLPGRRMGLCLAVGVMGSQSRLCQ
ncbi:hypothetical protein PG996_015836 [Apiospora saccharicola]|uniref:Uncharacterized protein n=1 Tax=Apiospora saccharicola TaxID=335842 RepID=A0ABR1TMH7_9PEZI